jgi:hypothetical protein
MVSVVRSEICLNNAMMVTAKTTIPASEPVKMHVVGMVMFGTRQAALKYVMEMVWDKAEKRPTVM